MRLGWVGSVLFICCDSCLGHGGEIGTGAIRSLGMTLCVGFPLMVVFEIVCFCSFLGGRERGMMGETARWLGVSIILWLAGLSLSFFWRLGRS